MAVLERTEGGYTKVQDKNGVVSHRDPNGHPVKQQAFAGSRQQEKYDTVVTERDPETGQIEQSYKERKEPPETFIPDRRNIRVTATWKRDTNDTAGYGPGDVVTGTVEIGGVFSPRNEPTDAELIQRIHNILEDSEVGGFMAQSFARMGTNVERRKTESDPTGFDPAVSNASISFERGKEHLYDVDAEQQQFDV